MSKGGFKGVQTVKSKSDRRLKPISNWRFRPRRRRSRLGRRRIGKRRPENKHVLHTGGSRKLPNPGGDITNIAFTAPGVVGSTRQTGYGNFTANGLPGTSNLFTVNGENDMDPYFNINNTGATNLTLGSNEVQEATVMTNPYSAQYGQFMGAQVSYITKSGTNEFHGNAQYWWNGRYLNANNWFNKWQTPEGRRTGSVRQCQPVGHVLSADQSSRTRCSFSLTLKECVSYCQT